MKFQRFLALFLAVALSLTATACQKQPVYDTSPEFNPETDHQYFWQCIFGYEVAESPDGYYYISDENYIHFVDKTTLKDIVVCSKPNCNHEANRNLDAADPMFRSCEGYIDIGHSADIFYYNGKLYTIEYSADIEGMTIAARHYYLLEISLDGSYRKRIHEFDITTNSNGKGNPMVLNPMLHRGRFYYSVCYDTNDYEFFYYYDFQTGKATMLHEGGSIQQVTARGDYLYLALSYDDGTVFEHWRYTISTGEKELVGEYPRNFYENGMCEKHYTLGEDGIANKFWMTHLSNDEETIYSVDLPGWLDIVAVNETYLIAEWTKKNTYQEISTGDIYTYDEYMERCRTLEQSLSSYRQYNTPMWSIFDSRTMKEIYQILIPDEIRTSVILRNDQIYVFNRFSENAFIHGNLSVPYEEFQWVRSEKVN